MTEPIILDAGALNGWRKSSYSGNEGGSCVEVLDNHPAGVPVRDSKTPNGPALVFPSTGWSSFVTAVKGETFPPSTISTALAVGPRGECHVAYGSHRWSERQPRKPEDALALARLERDRALGFAGTPVPHAEARRVLLEAAGRSKAPSGL